jgi:hypothetical protein
VEAVDRGTPPPLQQPGVPGRGSDPAADAWLPESTLDPATRAWLTGADRAAPSDAAPSDAGAASAGQQEPAVTPVDAGSAGGDDLAPRSAPSHVHGSGSGLGDWTGRSTGGSDEVPVEPPLDPDAFPAEPLAPQDDPEVQRADAWDERGAEDQGSTPPAPAAETAAEPAWSRPSAPAAPPTGPSWWIGRAPSADAASEPTSTERTEGDEPRTHRSDEGPRPGDTAVFQLPAERRAPRPTPLVPPGTQSTICHVCGHTLEPDDIFCEECGSVRPAVTAAFTGPVMPLPLTRPDWAADEDALRSAVSDAHDLTEESDGLPDAASTDSGGTAEAGDTAGADDAVRTGDTARAGDAARADDQDGTGDGAEAAGWSAADAPGGSDVSDDRGASSDRDGADDLDGRGTDARGTDDLDARGTDGSPATTAPEDPADTGSEAAGRPSIAPDAGDGTGAGHGARDGAGAGAGVGDGGELTIDDASAPPAAAPLPPIAPQQPGGTDADGAAAPTDDDDPNPDEDVEETRIVSHAPVQAPFLLHFSTGERLGVHGSALLGRLPRPEADEQFDGLLTIRDPGKSVSKTHLELGRDGDDLWVSDRYSGNGTMIRHIDGSIRRCEPGRRYRVERGARVDIGEQFFLVQ